MKKRMRRIREDIWDRLPEKMKCRKNKKQSLTSVNKICPNESKVEAVKSPKEKEAKINDGFNDHEVHPFQIAE